MPGYSRFVLEPVPWRLTSRGTIVTPHCMGVSNTGKWALSINPYWVHAPVEIVFVCRSDTPWHPYVGFSYFR